MLVPAEARRSVMFLGEVTGGKFIPRATAFLAVTGEKDHFIYLITAEHVIAGIAYKQKELFARFNLKDGTVCVQSLQSAKWWYHPTSPDRTDVAISPVSFDWAIIDHLPIPLFESGIPDLSPKSICKQRPIGLGDETFTIGLFRSHYGAQRNIPIVRIGNIAAMPEEPIKTKGGFIDAYLVEMRSIAGLSGSPVFVDRPQLPPDAPSRGPLPIGFSLHDYDYFQDTEKVHWFKYHFLGLVHGHFDVPSPLEDMANEDDSSPIGINTGMGVVIPAGCPGLC